MFGLLGAWRRAIELPALRAALFGVRMRILMPVLLVGSVTVISDTYLLHLVDADNREITASQDTSLEVIGLAMNANTNLTRVNLIVTQVIGSGGIDAEVRDAFLGELQLNVSRVHLALRRFDLLGVDDISKDSLRNITTVVDQWHDRALDIVNGDLSGESDEVAEFIELNGRITHFLSLLLDRAHKHAVSNSKEIVDQTAAREEVALVVMLILTLGILAVSAILSSSFASTLREISLAMRALAQGNLDVDIRPHTRRDELGDLSRSLEVFRTAMRNVVDTKATMEQMALTDALTGLPNRRGLSEFFSICRQRPGIGGTMLGVMHIDLDHFKTVNDTLGHDAGDFVLKEASTRMSNVIRRGDLLARIGGDEFVVILPDIPGEAALETLGARIIAQFQSPMMYEEHPCTIGASVGAVQELFDPQSTDLEDLLHKADIALGDVKSTGRNDYRLFDASMGRRREDKAKISRDITRGLAFDEFVVHFQPIVDVSSDAVTGIEMLARWQHPDLGMMLPDAFLPAAEAYQLLDELALQVLECGCNEVRKFRLAGQDLPVLHLNLSRSQILSAGMIDQMNWRIDNAGLAPENLAIEVSESDCVGRGADAVIANLQRLRDLGHPTVVDSFGDASGAIKLLARTRASQVKISRGVMNGVRDGVLSDEDGLLVRAALSAGQSLGLSVVGKGVETKEQIKALRRLGVTELQGLAIAPTMTPEELADWLPGRLIANDALHRSILARPAIAG
ncbi:MAG: EAL domain-containing protein [Pseudomonadota bacterium]